ncbi:MULTISPECIES: oxidoreductase [unclassified Streptomyces]|uniref:oxidoreductase n=1 Tax=unclassified Streptomyces TaxID=2593676 RepID=UPI000DC765F0|nr:MULTISPECIES: oxidoreductase [unclassified Streptomyces]AWZ08740.1 short-chain dehydrogenase [Streptomyces sp. ICC4]AWZ16533.1 short-chain dehydrogenase [Streptomyces sp. ICC1]
MPGWKAAHIPDQSGRTAVVTGANSGIGYFAARELARRGAAVVLACRSAARGRAAEVALRSELPGADVRFIPLDLADLATVREFAREYGQRHGSLDLLVNNAGVMALPYGRTADGFETQFGVNHLGHFALTGLLLPGLLAAGPGARVVNLSSGFHALGDVDHEDLNGERRYRRWIAYGRSKTANLLFTHELARRLAAAGSGIVTAAAHPGYASTNLHVGATPQAGTTLTSRITVAANTLGNTIGNGVIAQSAASGALPTLYAATAPGVRPDEFIGPRLGWRGAPARSWRAKWTLDDKSGERLWSASEKLTGVSYASLSH